MLRQKPRRPGSSDASYSSDDKSDSADKGENSAKAAGAGDGAAQAVTLNFGGQRTLAVACQRKCSVGLQYGDNRILPDSRSVQMQSGPDYPG